MGGGGGGGGVCCNFGTFSVHFFGKLPFLLCSHPGAPWCCYTLYPLKWILNPFYINYSCCYTLVDLTTNTKE